MNCVASEPRCFVKLATESNSGDGVKCMKGESSREEFKSFIARNQVDIVVQKPIDQGATLGQFNPISCNTIRVFSMLKKDGSVKIYSNAVRMGRNGAEVDNGGQGGLMCGVESDGRLKSIAWTLRGEKFTVHPDSKIKFSDVKIPKFDDLMYLVKKLHLRVPRFRLVSWDFALDKSNNPVLIEANLYTGGIEIHQILNGPMFGDDLSEIMDEVFGTKK